MLAFSQTPVHTTAMPKTATRILNAGKPDQTIIAIRHSEKSAMLVCGDNIYWLVPANIPDEQALMRMLKKETIESYLAIVDMLREMIA
jgi:hypothetical protein